MALARLKSVAGITIPDTALCNAAVDLLEAALVHLGAGLELFGLGLERVLPRLVKEVLERYPRLNFKAEFRNLLIEHCRLNPAAQVLNWTDDVARAAGCTLQGQPIPTASQLMSVAPYAE
jgi:hypothetical protein